MRERISSLTIWVVLHHMFVDKNRLSVSLNKTFLSYPMTHSTHFINGYMASDIWLRTILIVRKETRCRHIGYSFQLTARVLLYAPSHSLCYTSRGALAGARNSSMGPPHEGSIRWPIAPWATSRSCTVQERSTHSKQCMTHVVFHVHVVAGTRNSSILIPWVLPLTVFVLCYRGLRLHALAVGVLWTSWGPLLGVRRRGQETLTDGTVSHCRISHRCQGERL